MGSYYQLNPLPGMARKPIAVEEAGRDGNIQSPKLQAMLRPQAGGALVSAKAPRARAQSMTFRLQHPAVASRFPGGEMYRHEKTGTNYIVNKNQEYFIQSDDGHFYRVPPHDLAECQVEKASTLEFTPQGLDTLRKKYHKVPGTAAFIYSIFGLDHQYKQLQDMAEHPKHYPYFADEKFFIVPNAPYYTPANGEDLTHAKAQKLKDEGIVLCGWFMHDGLSCLRDEKSKALLGELDVAQKGNDTPVLDSVREAYGDKALKPTYTWDNGKRDTRPISEIEKEGGEYLASILDLHAGHLPMLKKLERKITQHLRDTYAVGQHDKVDLYFHFPYIDSTVTLHLHIRVNHGLHPCEKKYGFSLHEIIAGLEKGQSINDLVLEHQKASGNFYCMHEKNGFYRDIEGITIEHEVENRYRLQPESRRPVRVNSIPHPNRGK